MSNAAGERNVALSEFTRARRQANLERLAAWFRGREATLLPFETIRQNLKQGSPLYRGIQEVPVDKIVGSVGRYHEMTRQFLPMNDALRERWVTMVQMAQSGGWPPVELYKVGNAYFVRDGNHRISAARQLKMSVVEAYIWEFPEDIEIGPDDHLDEILVRFRERSFLEKTRLDRRADYDIRFTTSGRYSEFQAQIEELRLSLQMIDERDISFEAASDAWYDLVYLPTVQIIRESDLLDTFPGRTEADLVAWMSIHRHTLEDVYGSFSNLAELVEFLIINYRESTAASLTRRAKRLLLGSDVLPPLVGLDDVEKDEEGEI